MEEILSGLTHFENNPRLKKRIAFMIIAWRQAYPDIDVKKELGWANSWCECNPSKKPKSDYARFLNIWMQNAQKWALNPIKPPSLPPVKRYEVPEEEICTPDMFADLKAKLKRS